MRRLDTLLHPCRNATVHVDDGSLSHGKPGESGLNAELALSRVLVIQNAFLSIEEMAGDRSFPTMERVFHASPGVVEVAIDVSGIGTLENHEGRHGRSRRGWRLAGRVANRLNRLRMLLEIPLDTLFDFDPERAVMIMLDEGIGFFTIVSQGEGFGATHRENLLGHINLEAPIDLDGVIVDPGLRVEGGENAWR